MKVQIPPGTYIPSCVDIELIDRVPIEFHRVYGVVAQRNRRCKLCNRAILKGTRYTRWVWRRWFQIDDFPYHNACFRTICRYKEATGKTAFSHYEVLAWITKDVCVNCHESRCFKPKYCRRLWRRIGQQKSDFLK